MLKISNTSLITKLFIAFLALDIVLLAAHFMFGQQVILFNIDIERNIPTTYQSFKLILAGTTVAAVFAIAYFRNYFKSQLLLIPYALGFIYLALDEIAEIHENLAVMLQDMGFTFTEQYKDFFVELGFNSAHWLLFFVPLMIGAIIYLVFLAKHLHQQQIPKMYLMALAILSFACVPLVEYWNTSEISYLYSFDQRNMLIGLEEFLEMLGATFFLTFNLILLRFHGSKIRKSVQ